MDWVVFIMSGTVVTLQYSLLAVFFGTTIGIILALMSLSKITVLRLISGIYLSIIRGTPLLLQLSIVYFALPGILNINIIPFTAGVIAFSMNSGAYVSEIIRSGIISVDKGQFEAARALSIPYSLITKDIILPQALRNIIPALVNEFINLIKESAIISIIGEADLMRRAQLVVAQQYTYFAPLIVAGVCYYVVILLLSLIAKRVEKKLQCY